jgi:hypothetical protein
VPTLNDHAARVKADAVADATRGWRVLPVHGIHAGRCTCGRSGCENPGKHPRLAGWPELATTDVRTITREWHLYWHTSNLGVATGHGLLVLDVDPRHDGDASLLDLERQHGPLPDTPRAITGNGTHHFFKVDVSVHNKVSLAPGIDIRGDGGFIVAPPSMHVSGRHYAWDIAAHPDETPIAPAPRWLLDLCGRPAVRSSTPGGAELHSSRAHATTGCSARRAAGAGSASAPRRSRRCSPS